LNFWLVGGRSRQGDGALGCGISLRWPIYLIKPFDKFKILLVRLNNDSDLLAYVNEVTKRPTNNVILFDLKEGS